MVSENVMDESFIAYVAVTDRDSALNAAARCRLDDQSSVKFQLVQLGHNEFKVTAATFDREEQDVYHVVISCDVRPLTQVHANHCSHCQITNLRLRETRSENWGEQYMASSSRLSRKGWACGW